MQRVGSTQRDTRPDNRIRQKAIRGRSDFLRKIEARQGEQHNERHAGKFARTFACIVYAQDSDMLTFTEWS
jgi:hypothetical protein